MKSGHLKWIMVCGIFGVIVAIFSQLNFGDSLVYFYVPAEAVPQAQKLSNKTIKIGAMVKKGTVDWRAKELKLAFILTDFEGNDLKVRYNGIKPDMFKEGQGVVVEGRISPDGRSFKARTLMVKHSEEYKKPEGKGHSLDKELLKKSIFKE
tara:strand:+ start:201 stop:653 length:453 start_codon:yes stop_codon:yes gene_type:complete